MGAVGERLRSYGGGGGWQRGLGVLWGMRAARLICETERLPKSPPRRAGFAQTGSFWPQNAALTKAEAPREGPVLHVWGGPPRQQPAPTAHRCGEHLGGGGKGGVRNGHCSHPPGPPLHFWDPNEPPPLLGPPPLWDPPQFQDPTAAGSQ